MASKQKLIDAVAALGGAIDWGVSFIERGEKHICIDAPAGMVWSANGAPCLVQSWYSGTASEFYDDVLADLADGLNQGEQDD